MIDLEKYLDILEKEEVPEKEKKKIREEVFDQETIETLMKLQSKGVFEGLSHIIAKGKEANVFYAPPGFAVKIYRIETSSFRNMTKYIEGDPRFGRIRRRKRDIVFAWCRKEFKNLETAVSHGVSAPLPVDHMKNVLVMEFLGEGDEPYPMLKETVPPDPDGFFWQVIDNVRKLREANLVHADLSEYNILVGDGPYLIDFGQAVPFEHPMAWEFFNRDLENLVRIGKSLGIETTTAELRKEIL